jgi:hypothetical protein
MPNNLLSACIIFSLLLLPGRIMAAGDLLTLFTTPQERQLINANRYKSDEIKLPQQPAQEATDKSPPQFSVQEEVSVDYRISGISLSADGTHTAWINSVAYEDGARLDDGSRVMIMPGDDVRVRITAPDGKHYFATSGETISVTYMAAVEN